MRDDIHPSLSLCQGAQSPCFGHQGLAVTSFLPPRNQSPLFPLSTWALRLAASLGLVSYHVKGRFPAAYQMTLCDAMRSDNNALCRSSQRRSDIFQLQIGNCGDSCVAIP